MITKAPKPKKRPYWASPDVWERTSGIVTVGLLGHHYELPVTETTKPFLVLLDGAFDPWEGFCGRRSDFKRRHLAESGLMDIIAAVYSQVEAVSVANAAQMMAQDIQQKLEPLIQRSLHQRLRAPKPAPAIELASPSPKEESHG